MLKWFYLGAALQLVLALLLTKTAFGSLVTLDYQSLEAPNQYPEAPKSKVDVPICYIQTADGRILNLQQLCTKTSPINSNLFPESNSSSSDSFSDTPRRRFGTGSGYASDGR